MVSLIGGILAGSGVAQKKAAYTMFSPSGNTAGALERESGGR